MQPQSNQLHLRDLKDNIETVFDKVYDSPQTLEVIDGTGRVAVVMNASVYQDKLKELGILKAILMGERDLTEGRVFTHEQVMAEMNDLIK